MDDALSGALGLGVSEDRVKGLSLEALNEGLKLWLDPMGFRIGVVGDPEQLKALPKP